MKEHTITITRTGSGMLFNKTILVDGNNIAHLVKDINFKLDMDKNICGVLLRLKIDDIAIAMNNVIILLDETQPISEDNPIIIEAKGQVPYLDDIEWPTEEGKFTKE